MTPPRTMKALVAALALLSIAAACSSSTTQETTSAQTVGSEVSIVTDEPAAPAEKEPAGAAASDGETDLTARDETETIEAEPAPDTAPAPTTADDLAADLSRAETALRRPEADDEAEQKLTAAWARRQQFLYRVLLANPDWAPTVLAAADPTVLDAVEANWQAQESLASLVLQRTLSPTLPAWRINEPLPPEELLGYYREAAELTGVPWEVLAAINLVETRMGRIEGVSTAGAIGPMQFLPSTWEECCEGDPAEDRDAIIGAATYLVRRGAPEDLSRALKGYNNSDFYVEAVEAYASVMRADERQYRSYHAWEVYFWSATGLVLLPVGYESLEPVDADEWLAEHPESLLFPLSEG